MYQSRNMSLEHD